MNLYIYIYICIHIHTYVYVFGYIYTHTHACVHLYICTLKLYTLWIICKILKPDRYDNKLFKLKPTQFGFAEEKYLITDIILEYWSMEMVIKTEPAFTWVYSCNKSLRGQCPPVLPARDVGYSPCPTCGSPLLLSKSFGPKKTYRWITNTWKDAEHHSLSEKCKSKPQWGTISRRSGWLLSKHLQAINAWEKGTLLLCWGECKLIQPLWRIVWRFLKKLALELPYDPAIPLLGIHIEETRIERDTCTPLFITALFTIGRTWKQPRGPSADEWTRK